MAVFLVLSYKSFMSYKNPMKLLPVRTCYSRQPESMFLDYGALYLAQRKRLRGKLYCASTLDQTQFYPEKPKQVHRWAKSRKGNQTPEPGWASEQVRTEATCRNRDGLVK